MLVRFWGTRGSIPTAMNNHDMRSRVMDVARHVLDHGGGDLEAAVDAMPFHLRGTYGGESSCVQIDTGGDEYVVCDMGSGARRFALDCLGRHGPGSPKTYNVFQSHVHWDHIMGFPFFVPAYIPGNVIRIHGCHDVLEQAYRGQQSDPCFPVPFDFLGSTIEFVRLEPDRIYQVAGVTVTPFRQLHHGDSYGYRFEKGGKTVVYSTDSEHKLEDRDHLDYVVGHFRGADVVVFDSMYSLAESTSLKEDWGHSSNMVGVELCHQAGVGELCLFHHEPIYSDAQIDQVLAETVRYEEIARGEYRPLKVTASYDGLEVTA
ncbi:MAG: MBL fold metallo-hydrolase [Rhizobiales bacterium NRL2]|jgi:phosphoribosyl 1,2-cyclic phosphodiesterase|nr:MAG: MBL fold metallo-hydrolase [Rhizobiales bacterium NRL2]